MREFKAVSHPGMSESEGFKEEMLRNKRYVLLLVLIVFLGRSWIQISQASDSNMMGDGVKASPLKVTDTYIRAMPPGQAVTAGYLVIQNLSDQDYFLVGAQAPDIASSIELHQIKLSEDGVVKMIRRKQFKIPANGLLEMKPGGEHLMIMGLKRTLSLGESISLKLELGNGKSFVIPASIRRD